MKANYFAFAILALVLATGLASALTISPNPSVLTISRNTSTLTVTNNDLNTSQTISVSLANNGVGAAMTPLFLVNPTSVSLSNTGSPTTSTLSLSLNPAVASLINTEFRVGETRDVTINAMGSGTNITTGTSITTNATTTVSFQRGFCSSGPAGGNLSISDIDIDSTGDENEEWFPFDVVTIRVDVEANNNDEDVEDVIVEIGLFDSSGRNQVGKLDFESDDEEEYDVGSVGNDEETATFEFTIPGDLDRGSYRLAVKTYSQDVGQSRECTDVFDGDLFQTVSVEREGDRDKAIIVDDIQVPQQISCGETVQGSFRVSNIGTRDEDQVLVTLMNRDLGLDQDFVIRDNLDEGDDASLDFSFDVPQNVRDGSYVLQFRTFSDYDNGDYDVESEDAFTQVLRVVGCTSTPSAGNFDISASLDSDAVAGQPLVVNAVIRNMGTTTSTLTINSQGHESWATLVSISPSALTLAPGASERVTLTFDVKDSASGAKSFLIQTNSAGSIESQEIRVPVSEVSSPAGFSIDFGSPLTWVLIGINVILVILIIVVAVRLSSRRE